MFANMTYGVAWSLYLQKRNKMVGEIRGERFLAFITRAKTVSSFRTRLRVPPLARWTVRERVRTSGYSWPHAMPSVAHAALGTSCSVACEPAARYGDANRRCSPYRGFTDASALQKSAPPASLLGV
ncbi:hypothetical protein Desmer_2479 [Desulfosporosinus meridiei DSM 13257]|uniref:Uncharacterized protein n=1 Tax=Desulfosporosinus meridiei (strain ATCC BAA-275 / DSM 13257 / KCTC 12902 / NCIMB 13706 / S10) TaxID=768704 RepID=J7IRC8_DESMD|nr:hypothetical protein Desmer_2479 [Desulfosporosinus meridiei DSM 13257]